jgi:EmrB/QacA subfamily drug resistance transporter
LRFSGTASRPDISFVSGYDLVQLSQVSIMESDPDVNGGCNDSAGRWVLAAAILGSSISFIDGTVVNVALPILQRDLDATVGQTQWVVESYALMLSALILVGGSLGDLFGRKKIFSIGVLGFGIASALCGIAQDANQLIVARGVQGIGAALLVPGSLALISASFSKKRRGRAIGTWSGLTAIAAGIGPVLGGWLIETFSWRWIFFINIPLVAAVLFITWFRVPESRDEESEKQVDWLGAGLATIGLGGVVFALIEANSRGLGSSIVIASFLIGILSLAAFVVVQAQVKHPMMPLGLFRSRAFLGSNLLTLFLYGALGGLMFFLPFILIQVQGYGPTEAGAALMPFVITMSVLGRWAGGLVDRYGSKIPLTVGPLIAACGFALYAVPGADASSYWTSYFPAVMVMSAGMAIAVAPLTTTVMGAVEESHAGTASGINNAVSRTAGLIAVAAFGVVLVTAFEQRFLADIRSMDLPSVETEQLIEQGDKLAEIRVPDTVPGDQALLVEASIKRSFVSGFRIITMIAAALGVLSSIVAWVLIPGKTR